MIFGNVGLFWRSSATLRMLQKLPSRSNSFFFVEQSEICKTSLRDLEPVQNTKMTSQPLWVLERHMGWLRWVGSLKVQVSFAKEPYKRDDILQKRPVIWRSLLVVAPPHTVFLGDFSQEISQERQKKALERQKKTLSLRQCLVFRDRDSISGVERQRQCLVPRETVFLGDILLGDIHGVATMSRLLKMIGLFCRISSHL